MIVAVKFSKNDRFLGVLGIFTTKDKAKVTLNTAVVEKKGAKAQTLLEHLGCVVKLYDAPPDDHTTMLEDCPEITLD